MFVGDTFAQLAWRCPSSPHPLFFSFFPSPLLTLFMPQLHPTAAPHRSRVSGKCRGHFVFEMLRGGRPLRTCAQRNVTTGLTMTCCVMGHSSSFFGSSIVVLPGWLLGWCFGCWCCWCWCCCCLLLWSVRCRNSARRGGRCHDLPVDFQADFLRRGPASYAWKEEHM